MPMIMNYKCSNCDFELPSGWGGYTYVVDAKGKRIVCPHPVELSIIEKVLGPDVSREERQRKTGFNSHCICMKCLKQFDADFNIMESGEPKDPRRCPKCKSVNVLTENELVGKTCPKCKKGTIQELSTGCKS
nr:hypothetical protein [Candidatus Sigynarchaeota archaeon]